MERSKNHFKKIIESNYTHIQKKDSTSLFSDMLTKNKSSKNLLAALDDKTQEEIQVQKEQLLMLESRLKPSPIQPSILKQNIENIPDFELHLHSFNNRVGIEHLKIKSSIDSNKKAKESTSKSIPLSELILMDMGYDHLFHTKSSANKNQQKYEFSFLLEQKYIKNIEQLVKQTQELFDLNTIQLMQNQEENIKQQIFQCESEIKRIKSNITKKNKSPILDKNDYLRTKIVVSPHKNSIKIKQDLLKQRHKSQRLSGKLMQINHYYKQIERKSNTKTQCDSKIPSIPSAPITPINYNKQFSCSDNGQREILEYINILKSKRDILKISTKTISDFIEDKCDNIIEQIKIFKEQIKFIEKIIENPYELRDYKQRKTRNNKQRLTDLNYIQKSLSTKKFGNRVLTKINSPKSARKLQMKIFKQVDKTEIGHQESKKRQFINLIATFRNEAKNQPSDEYFLSSR